MRTATHEFSKAVTLHRRGRLADAEGVYRKILRFDPDHADSLHLLGLIVSEAGHHDAATVLIGRAIQVRGPLAMYCSNLGLVFTRMSKPEQATACYRQALQTDPSDAATWSRLGRLLLHGKEWKAAKAALRKSAALQTDAATLFDLGSALFALQEFDDAGAAYQTALRAQPEYPEALYNLGVIRTIQKRTGEAIQTFEAAIALRPAYPDAHNNLGILFQSAGRYEEALVQYRQALAYHPDASEARYNGAALLERQDCVEEARDEYRELLRRHPGHPEAHNNLGNTLLALGQPQLANAEYEKALDANPEHPQANWNRGIAQLTLGNFREGWAGYEWRFRQMGSPPTESTIPAWAGEPLQGRRILLQAEQGLGDTLQFIRYARLVKSRGASVLLECPAPLQNLLRDVQGVDQAGQPASPPTSADYRCPLLSLPRLFSTDLDSVPWSGPYLHASPQLTEKWAQLTSGLASNRLRVGLCWAGNPEHKHDRHRSIPARELEMLAGMTDIAFFNLQKTAAGQPDLPFVPLPEPSLDFDDTAALIANLDLVISVDTSIAHLAGGLGQPVWILLPFAADWRWMMDRADSPWYPTARLFRQEGRKDWPGVLDRVRRELAQLKGIKAESSLCGPVSPPDSPATEPALRQARGHPFR